LIDLARAYAQVQQFARLHGAQLLARQAALTGLEQERLQACEQRGLGVHGHHRAVLAIIWKVESSDDSIQNS